MKSISRVSLVALCCAAVFHCSGKSNIQVATPGNNDIKAPNEATSVQARVLADTGATLAIGSQVQLTVPAGALTADTDITVDKKSIAPAQGIVVPVAKSIELGAHGTQFNKTVALNVCYDPQVLASQGLYEETLAVYYVDAQTGEYGSVGGSVNRSTHCVSANIEHFSTYLVAAQNLSVNLPVADQLPQISVTYLPGTPIAGLPVKVRAAITDFKLTPVSNGTGVQVGFGQIATVRYCYYTAPATACSGGLQNLAPDYDDEANNFYSFVIPANQVTTQGFTVSYEVYNSLGFKRTRTVNYVPTRTATGIQFTSNAVVNLAAGFKRSYTVQGLSDTGTPQNIPVDSFTLNGGIGTATQTGVSVIRVTGTTANPQAMRTGSLTATAGAFSVTSADINVHAGLLDHISLLSPTGVVLGNTITINANTTYDFDILGYDAFGNTSNVLPQFVLVPVTGAGTISSTGLYTAPATAQSATLVATLNGVSDSILINVQTPVSIGLPPAMVVPPTVPTLALGMGLANNGIDTYAIWIEVGSPGWNLVLSRWNGVAWIHLATATSTTAIFNADLAFVNGQPVIAYTSEEVSPSPPLRNIRFYRWNGAALELIGSPAIGGVSASTGQVDIVANGNQLYATWQELTGGFYNIHVAVWNSGSNVWSSPFGAQVNPVGVSGYFPKIEIYQSQPLVLFSANGAVTLRRWDGVSTWAAVSSAVSGDLNFPGAGTQINGPQLAVDGSHIYLAWSAFDGSMTNVYAGHYDAGLDTYVFLGGGAADSFSTFTAGAFVSLRLYSGVPYLAYYKEDPAAFKTYVQHFSGGIWVPDFNSSSPTNFAGPSFNETATKHNTVIALSEVSGLKYVTFVEFDGAYLGSPSTMYLRTLP